MTDDEIISAQLDFFSRNGSGCGFAALAAKDPTKYEWEHLVVQSGDYGQIDDVVQAATEREGVSTLSLVFPEVVSDDDLDSFLPLLDKGAVHLNAKVDTATSRCYRFRAKIGDEESFVSGFGDFGYMPITRQTKFTSIVMRVKPRPNYDWFLQPPEEGIIHVADMNMQGMSDRNLKQMWNNTYFTTRGKLGHNPDEESAAKTTFVIPLPRAQGISL